MNLMVCILKMDCHNPVIPNTEGQEVVYDESAKPYVQSGPKSGPEKLSSLGCGQQCWDQSGQRTCGILQPRRFLHLELPGLHGDPIAGNHVIEQVRYGGIH